MSRRVIRGEPCANRPSGAVQDYLVAIHALEIVARGPVGTGAIAAAVGVTTPSAVKMGKHLATRGLAERAPRRGLRLTAVGRRAAQSTLRRQRVLEAFLVQRLGWPPDRVQEEACHLAHVVSEAVIKSMYLDLGHSKRGRDRDPAPPFSADVDEMAVAMAVADSPADEVGTAS